MRRTLTGLLAFSVLASCGCVGKLIGGGEVGLGYRSESKLFAYHTVDGDKQGKTSTSELDLDPLMDLFLKWKSSQEVTDGAEDIPDTE